MEEEERGKMKDKIGKKTEWSSMVICQAQYLTTRPRSVSTRTYISTDSI